MGSGGGLVASECQWEGGAKPDGLVILRYQNQTLLSIQISEALFISVIVYPPTQYNSLLFHFSSKMQERTALFTFTQAKPLSKVHVCNKRSNSDYDPQDILLHSRMVNKWAKNFDTEKLNLSEKLSVEYHFKPLLRNTRLTRLTSFNVPGNSEMNRSTFHRSTSCIFFKSGDKRKQIQHCKYLLKEKRCNL